MKLIQSLLAIATLATLAACESTKKDSCCAAGGKGKAACDVKPAAK